MLILFCSPFVYRDNEKSQLRTAQAYAQKYRKNIINRKLKSMISLEISVFVPVLLL